MPATPIENLKARTEQLICELNAISDNASVGRHSAVQIEAAYTMAELLKHIEGRPSTPVTPQSVLQQAEAMIDERGRRRDAGQERSMQRIVKTFEALTDHRMTEVEGWLFMVVLKLCRERTGPDLDNWIDGAAYMGLAAEAVEKSRADPLA